MEIDSIKRWQWAIVGLIAGLLVSASHAFFAGEYPGHSLDKNFDIAVSGAPDAPVMVGFFFGPKKWLYLSDLVIHPAATQTPVYWVTGKLHELNIAKSQTTPGKTKWEEASVTEFFHRTTTPYLVARTSYPTVMAYLDEVVKRTAGKSGRYRTAWWEKPAAVWTIYPTAGVLLIGGVWPTILGLLTGAGFGRPREPAGLDLSQFSSTPTPTPEAAGDVNAEGRRQLETLTATMASNLQDGASSKSVALVPEQPSAIRTLDSESPPQSQDALPKRPKAFGQGDFYPTEIHHPADENSKSPPVR